METTVNKGQFHFAGQVDFRQKPALLQTTGPVQLMKNIQNIFTQNTNKMFIEKMNIIFNNGSQFIGECEARTFEGKIINIEFRLIKLTGVFQDESLILLDLEALISPYIKFTGKKIEKKADVRPKILEGPKVKPKLAPKPAPTVESTVVIPQKAPTPKELISIPSDIEPKKFSISMEQEDILKEIGNIGTGNAVTALSRLVKKKIDVTLTDVGIIPLDELPEQFGGHNEKVCGIFCHIDEPSQATILNIFEMTPLMKMIADLAGTKSKIEPNRVKSKKDLDKLYDKIQKKNFALLIPYEKTFWGSWFLVFEDSNGIGWQCGYDTEE